MERRKIEKLIKNKKRSEKLHETLKIHKSKNYKQLKIIRINYNAKFYHYPDMVLQPLFHDDLQLIHFLSSQLNEA